MRASLFCIESPAARMAAWAEYFSGGNGLYAISNMVGAIACDEALPAQGGAVLELGGGFGDSTLTLTRWVPEVASLVPAVALGRILRIAPGRAGSRRSTIPVGSER